MQANDYQAPDYAEHRYPCLSKTELTCLSCWAVCMAEGICALFYSPSWLSARTLALFSQVLLRVSMRYLIHFNAETLTSQIKFLLWKNTFFPQKLDSLVVQCHPGNFVQSSFGVLRSVVWRDVYSDEVLSSFPVRLPLKSSAQEGVQSRHTKILPKYPEQGQGWYRVGRASHLMPEVEIRRPGE